jgi:hypothetical protein
LPPSLTRFVHSLYQLHIYCHFNHGLSRPFGGWICTAIAISEATAVISTPPISTILPFAIKLHRIAHIQHHHEHSGKCNTIIKRRLPLMHPRQNEHDIQVCCSQPQPATNKETVAPIYSKRLCAIHHNTWAPTSTISVLIDELDSMFLALDGRNKSTKVLQYSIRLLAWWFGVLASSSVV